MGTDTTLPSNAVALANTRPGSQVGTDQVGLLVELRVISYLLVEGLNIPVDLDQLRRELVLHTT